MSSSHSYLILGSVASERQWARPGGNIPMSKWLAGFCSGFQENGLKPLLAGHCYERVWPWGRLFPGRREDFDHNYVTHSIRFLNLPFVRDAELCRAYYFKALSILREEPDVAAVLTYNPQPWHLVVARAFQKRGVRWVNLVLDYEESDLGSDWEIFRQRCGAADGHVFLSWWAYENAPVSPKLHMDSGCRQIHSRSKRTSGTRIVLYTGKINAYGGADIMAATFLATKGDDVEFWVCGKGESQALSEAARRDPRIRLFGFVGDEQLHDMCLQADVFFNPRDPTSGTNRMIFPSKILHYLSYCKPLVSTWTPGLHPEYKDFLFINEGSSAEALADLIEKALQMHESDLEALSSRIEAFLRNFKSWRTQTEKVMDFISTIQ